MPSNVYFTSPATLIPQTRVRAADLNNLNTATNTAFDNVQTAFVPTSGLASIVYGTNWALSGGAVATLKKTAQGQVFLYTEVTASASPGATLMTLPATYRPIGLISAVPCVIFDFSAPAWYPAFVTIATSGAITFTALPSSLSLTLALGDVVVINTNFWNV